jgi:hypothetical protein
MNDIEWLNNERKKHIKRNKQIIKVLAEINCNMLNILENYIDKETDPELINTAKYLAFWIEKEYTIDDPEITKYNNYKEVK